MPGLLDSLLEAGVVGAGGAGFPTHKKLDCAAEFLLVNGAECEPLLETDKYLMRNHARDIVAGAAMAKAQTGARGAFIVLKEKYSRETEALRQAIRALDAPVEIRMTGNFYPAGDEQVMVYEVLKRMVPPGGIPLTVNAVVSNVNTMAWVAGTAKGVPVTRRLVSVAGEVTAPMIAEVPVGTSVGDCIDAAGGPRIPSPWVVLGGPMMGNYLPWEEAKNEVVTKTTGGIIVVDAAWAAVEKKRVDIRQTISRAKSCCIQCSYCTEQCPRQLIGHPLRPHKLMRAIAFSSLLETDPAQLQEALLCSECGVCENYSCPMGLSPRRINQYIKKCLRDKGIRYSAEGAAPPGAPGMREYRLLPAGRLLGRLDGAKYEVHMDGPAKPLHPESVRIPLKQHVGMSADATVKPGDSVAAGQPVGVMAAGTLGANIHASIDGIVTAVNDCVHIRRRGGHGV